MKKLLCSIALIGLSSAAQASLTSIGDFTDNGGGSYTLSSGSGSVSDADVENFIGLPPGMLDWLSTGDATEGSAIKDTVAVSSGDVFSFDWVWTNGEGSGSPFNDFSFFSLSLDGVGVLADTFTPDGTASNFSWVATSTGMLTYGVGVMDTNDTLNSSYITVSNISATSVPEPSALALMGLGLAGLGFYRRKKVA